jgi:ribosomal protein L29
VKKKDFKDIKTKEVDELKKMIDSKRGELAKTVPNLKAGREKNLKKAKNLKREIAQILSLISEKEIMKKEEAK